MTLEIKLLIDKNSNEPTTIEEQNQIKQNIEKYILNMGDCIVKLEFIESK